MPNSNTSIIMKGLKEFWIKNMVCNRCKSTVLQLFKNHGFEVESIELGQVSIKEGEKGNYIELKSALKANGFEVIKDETEVLIEELKIKLIEKLEHQEVSNLSSFLPKTFNKSYAVISKIFSKHEGVTIEKYLIHLKIEKVKEYIQLGALNFSEIAYNLNYASSSHLARQFKNITGISMTEYKKLQQWNRKTLDQIV